MSTTQHRVKRLFDITIAILLLLLTWWIILAAFILAAFETRSNGFFIQKRVGQNGRIFSVFKIKTMYPNKEYITNITTENDPRITRSGRWFRQTKIDELPQLINVLIGDMSLVGPRPDVVGYADKLTGDDSDILMLKPGITGPATLKYRNEEKLLALQNDPKKYNDETIWPDKIRINREYLQHWTLMGDFIYLWRTIKT